MNYDRREFIRLAGVAGISGFMWPLASMAGARGKVVIVGGGFGGATCARYLRRWSPDVEITLIEKDRKYITCPFSNAVIAGLQQIDSITHNYNKITAEGIDVIHDTVTEIDSVRNKVTLQGGRSLMYDKLLVSPGISFKYGAIENGKTASMTTMPHAWRAGTQTLLLKKQLMAMDDGGTVIIIPPKKPFRCPPGPYERASLIASYLQKNKPKSKIQILDSNPSHSKQAAFHEAWKHEYGNMIEWIKDTDGGLIVSADPKNMTVTNDFGDKFKGDVINLIPAQSANNLVVDAGLTNKDGWCTVDMATFASTKAKDIHIIGDSCVAGAMPKSGFSAASQGKNAAAAILASLTGSVPPTPTYANACYSLINKKYGISVAAVYRLKNGVITKVSGGVSKLGNSDRVHKKEAKYARGWYKSIITDAFG